MFCRKCGSPISEGEKFCSICGEKVETVESMQQNQAQPPYGTQQPYGQQPYGAQQPSGNMYYNETKKSKKGLWIALSLVAVLAIAAVLIFAVFGNNQTVISQGPWPFKGDTPQTEFVNDTVRVFSNAFDGLGNEGIDFKKLAEQPFDINMDITADVMGQAVDFSLNAAYDKETLGMNLNAMGSSIKLLLIEDVLYMDTLGNVTGVDFNSFADLSKPMSLQDRMTALVEGLGVQQSTLSEEDYIAIAELLINSIDAKCFEKGDSKATLTLHTDDVVATLRTFAQKLDANEKLKKMLENYAKESSGSSVDVVKEINDAADSLEQQKDTQNLEIVWAVFFENEKPVSFEISANDGAEEYVLTFGYEKNGDSTDITFEFAPGSSLTGMVTGSFSYKKTSSGLQYAGSITVDGQILTISGSEEYNGDNAHGTMTINIPDTGEFSLEYDSALKIGMPGIKVKDDERFEIDTSNATITDASSSFGMPGLTGLY